MVKADKNEAQATIQQYPSPTTAASYFLCL